MAEAEKIALDLQIGYKQIKELFGGRFSIIKEKDYNKKFNNISSSGSKQHTYAELKDLILFEVEGILWKDKNITLNESISYQSTFAMDVIDVVTTKLPDYYNERLLIASFVSRVKPAQLYNLGEDTIYTIPGIIEDGSEGYDVMFWQIDEVTATGK